MGGFRGAEPVAASAEHSSAPLAPLESVATTADVMRPLAGVGDSNANPTCADRPTLNPVPCVAADALRPSRSQTTPLARRGRTGADGFNPSPAKTLRLCNMSCGCCLDGPRRPTRSRAAATHAIPAAPPTSPEQERLLNTSSSSSKLVWASARSDGCRAPPYVDTHCHLEMVLQTLRRRQLVPTTNVNWSRLTSEERRWWGVLGWTRDTWGFDPCGENPVLSNSWAQLTPEEVEAATALGWTNDSWDRRSWPIGNVAWEDLGEAQRRHLAVLGEAADTWPDVLEQRAGGLDLPVDAAEKWTFVPNPTFKKPWGQLDSDTRFAATSLGWTGTSWNNFDWPLPDLRWGELSEEMRGHLVVLGETPESWAAMRYKYSPKDEQNSTLERQNPTWELRWDELTEPERAAATALGWESGSWDLAKWPLPRDVRWQDLPDDTRAHLAVLGEMADTWTAHMKVHAKEPAGMFGDYRTWDMLEDEEREAASKLGFTPPVWDMVECADVHDYIRDFCGDGFEGVVTQGCDNESFDDAQRLALAHPKVFASFGCHPKNAWQYDEKMEARLLAAFDSCGKKAVAWGEFGLDYSNEYWGGMEDYRNEQCQVFARQLQLAIARGMPLVLHIRDASEDALRLLRQYVPSHWKAHLHSFLGASEFVEQVCAEWPNFFIGLSGTVTMGDDGERIACLVTPDRVVLETDAPYLLPRGTGFNHVGQIPLIGRKVAKLHGHASPSEFLTKARANSRIVYGI
eukprot:TRINITY_DN48225_c0_g1_i1.p1 TRINITY_DN48225_c0_g1~~TRINITY_DN48225_c0_g1_i1.p1  ORF type:complete len:741 (-),score=145.43 TRINITY_DN48225_c0_g1_i1:364-2586(-)